MAYADYMVRMSCGETWTLRMDAPNDGAEVYYLDDEGEPKAAGVPGRSGDAGCSPLRAAEILAERWDNEGGGYGSNVVSVD